MKYDIRKALEEIMEIPPMFRREVIIDYIRKYLPREEAKEILFRKRKPEFWKILTEQGFTNHEEILEKIGEERINRFYHDLSLKA